VEENAREEKRKEKLKERRTRETKGKESKETKGKREYKRRMIHKCELN